MLETRASSEAEKLRKTISEIQKLPDVEQKASMLEDCLKEALESFERVTGEFRERVDDLRLVLEVNRDMTELLDPDQLLPQIAKGVSSRLGVERCSVMLMDESEEYLTIKVGLGFDVPVEEIPPAKIGEGIAGKVAASGEPLLIKNIEKDERFHKKSDKSQYKNKSLLCVPLKVRGRVIGVINVNNKKDGTPFTDSDKELLTILAGSAAVSIKNASLHREMQESWSYLNNVVEHINTGLLAVNAKRQVTLMNRAFRRLFGLEKISNPHGKTLGEALPDPVGKYFLRIVDRTWREGDQREVEVDIDLPEGEVLPADVSTLLLRDHQYQIQSQLVIVHDLSQSRELVKLRQLDTMKDNFISTISHELRTPLTSMLASISLIQQGFAGELSSQQSDLLQIVHRNAQRLKALINDLLDLSRLESGRTQLNFDMVDLDQLVLDCLSDLQHLAAEKNIRMNSSLQFAGKVEADPMKVQQVLINLVGNAVKFTPDEGQVTVQTCKGEDRAWVRVRDTGCGIPKDQLEKVFDRFYQVEDTLTRTQPGTGLGLPICRRIIELHSGEIRAMSKPGEGSCFEFWLPLGSRRLMMEEEVESERENDIEPAEEIPQILQEEEQE
jgi:signal transduction histidine kinase